MRFFLDSTNKFPADPDVGPPAYEGQEPVVLSRIKNVSGAAVTVTVLARRTYLGSEWRLAEEDPTDPTEKPFTVTLDPGGEFSHPDILAVTPSAANAIIAYR